MPKISLYDRAVGDYTQGKHALASAHVDDVMCDMAGYHLQQSVEKLLKYQIELQGDQFPYTHNISQLLDKITTPVPDWIIDNREKLTQYESLTRYSSVKVAALIDLKQMFTQLEKYLSQIKPPAEHNPQCTPKL